MWKVESDLKIAPSSECADTQFNQFALDCNIALRSAGAETPVISGTPAEGAVRAIFRFNSVESVTDAMVVGQDIVNKAALSMKGTWHVYAAGTRACALPD